MSIKEREWTNKDGSITRVWVSGYNDANGKWKTKQFNKKKDAQAHQDSVKTDVERTAAPVAQPIGLAASPEIACEAIVCVAAGWFRR